MHESYRDLVHCLAQAIGHLLGSREAQGHWGDSRSTALAIWAFSEVISSRNAQPTALTEIRETIRDATAWLVGQARREDGGYSWESEAWDTSLAVLALVSSADQTERIDQATAWLQRIRDPRSGVWYDEVWETSLATIAMLRAERSHNKPVHDVSYWLQAVLSWFLRIPSKEDGEFVCPHYSGFLAWILAEVKATRHLTAIQNTECFQAFREKTMAAASFLSSSKSSLGNPWSAYTFANAYISIGLSRLARHEPIDLSYSPTLIKWLRERQGSCGAFEDIEDTSLAIAAMSALLDAHEEGNRAYEEMAGMIPKAPCLTKRCFLGYSGTSTGIALEIKESLAKHLPTLEVRDWRWDFKLGNVLISEIEKMSRECQVCVFLVTKDDRLFQSGRSLTESPRDNIVFEVGYFAARLGLDHTLLIVEKGAKLPSDWGGVLYIPLRDRDNVAEVNLALIDGIRKVLHL